MVIGFNDELLAASNICWSFFRVNTEIGSSRAMLPISQSRLMLHIAPTTVFSHGRSIRILSTAAILG
jgi:hypothetical protein